MGDYHRELAKRRLSSKEIHETKRRMNVSGRLDSLEDKSGELEQTTADVVEYLGEDPEEGVREALGRPEETEEGEGHKL